MKTGHNFKSVTLLICLFSLLFAVNACQNEGPEIDSNFQSFSTDDLDGDGFISALEFIKTHPQSIGQEFILKDSNSDRKLDEKEYLTKVKLANK